MPVFGNVDRESAYITVAYQNYAVINQEAFSGIFDVESIGDKLLSVQQRNRASRFINSKFPLYNGFC